MALKSRYTRKKLRRKEVSQAEIEDAIAQVLQDEYYMGRLSPAIITNLQSPFPRERRQGYDSVCAFEALLVREGRIRES